MVLPITGPIAKAEIDGNGYDVKSSRKVTSRYTQAKPYDLPLPYSVRSLSISGGRATSYAPSDSWGGHWLGQWWQQADLDTISSNAVEAPRYGGVNWIELTKLVDDTLERARQKFFSEANQRSGTMVDILQYKQTYRLLVERAGQLGRFLLAVRQGRLGDAWRILGLPRLGRGPFDRWRTELRGGAGLWLEWSYGLKPLLKDIHDTAQLLSSSIDPQRLHAAKVVNLDKVYYSVYHPNDSVSQWTTAQQRVRLKIVGRVGGVVSVSNPNLNLAKNMGLTNPLSWVWELIPFSFVVDWAWNVGTFIEALDDTLGLTITDGYYSYGYMGTTRRSIILERRAPSWPHTVGREVGDGGFKQTPSAELFRKRGTPLASLRRKPVILTGIERGLNAASLLAQAIGRKPGDKPLVVS